ncbi:MAG: hypothetical protein ACREV7_05355 [Steroidobacteraceae bacterium]
MEPAAALAAGSAASFAELAAALLLGLPLLRGLLGLAAMRAAECHVESRAQRMAAEIRRYRTATVSRARYS